MNKIEAKNVDFYYGDFHALKNINITIPNNEVVAFIGPSGCGKSTFLRLFNRMNDLIPGTRLTGEIDIDGRNIYDPSVNVDILRKNVGMVFQRPNPFPKSIFENVAYGLRVNGIKDKDFITDRSRHGGRTFGLADGRTRFGTRPYLDFENRGVDLRTELADHGSHRDPQHAASCPCEQQDRFLLYGRNGGIR